MKTMKLVGMMLVVAMTGCVSTPGLDKVHIDGLVLLSQKSNHRFLQVANPGSPSEVPPALWLTISDRASSSLTRLQNRLTTFDTTAIDLAVSDVKRSFASLDEEHYMACLYVDRLNRYLAANDKRMTDIGLRQDPTYIAKRTALIKATRGLEHALSIGSPTFALARSEYLQACQVLSDLYWHQKSPAIIPQ